MEAANYTNLAMQLPEGNLTEMAQYKTGHFAVGLISITWTLWIIVSMLVSWQNSDWTGNYDPAVSYIWTLTGNNHVFESWLPSGYFWSWIINFFIFTVELFAWFFGGKIFLDAVTVGLWGGLILGAFPWIMEAIYITSEFPERNGGA